MAPVADSIDNAARIEVEQPPTRRVPDALAHARDPHVGGGGGDRKSGTALWLPIVISLAAVCFSIFHGHRLSTHYDEQILELRRQNATLTKEIRTTVGMYNHGKKRFVISLWRDWDRAFTRENRKKFDEYRHWAGLASDGERTAWMPFFVRGAGTTQAQIDAEMGIHPLTNINYMFEGGKATPQGFEDYRYSLICVLNAMEGIAVAYMQNAADEKMIDDSFRSVIPRYIEHLHGFIVAYRGEVPDAWKALTDVASGWVPVRETASKLPDPVDNISEPL